MSSLRKWLRFRLLCQPNSKQARLDEEEDTICNEKLRVVISRCSSFQSAVSTLSEEPDTCIPFDEVDVARDATLPPLPTSRPWWTLVPVQDVGPEAKILGRTLQVKILNRDQKSCNELGYFETKKAALKPSRRYIVVQLLMGAKVVVSLAKVSNVGAFDQIFDENSDKLSSGLKLIVNPTNHIPPWAITRPKASPSIADYFGPTNCSIKRKLSPRNIAHAVITVDLYSKFMIRSFLPKLAFQPGRCCDFLVLGSAGPIIHTGFRLVTTDALLNLLKTPHQYIKANPR